MTMLINNDLQYKKYLTEVHSLMQSDPDIDTVEGERLALLALAIKEYETSKFFFKTPTPIEAIRFRMVEQNLMQKDLIPYIGSKSKVSEILAGKRKLTIPMIKALNQYLKIPLNVLIGNFKSREKSRAVNVQRTILRTKHKRRNVAKTKIRNHG